jgi:uncharacterized protein
MEPVRQSLFSCDSALGSVDVIAAAEEIVDVTPELRTGTSFLSHRQEIKRALSRLLVASVAIAGSVLLVRFLLVPGIESVFDPGVSMTSLLRRTSIFLFVLLAYWIYVRYYERRAATELRIAPVGVAIGALSGALLISITTLSLFAVGVYQIGSHRGLEYSLLGVAGVIWVAAFLEEVIYRGVLFRILEQSWGTYTALGLQALIFGAMHLANVDANAAELAVTLVSVTLLGVFWACIYVHTRNLWIVSANHAAWNFAIVLSGAPLSGIEEWRAAAPIETQVSGPVWLSGGAFGPENSIITIAVLVLSLTLLLPLARKRNRLVASFAGRSPSVAVEPELRESTERSEPHRASKTKDQ